MYLPRLDAIFLQVLIEDIFTRWLHYCAICPCGNDRNPFLENFFFDTLTISTTKVCVVEKVCEQNEIAGIHQKRQLEMNTENQKLINGS